MRKASLVDTARINRLNQKAELEGCVVYWMHRDRRLQDNWAFLYSQEIAIELNQPLIAVITLTPEFLGGTHRQCDFMLRGLEEVEQSCRERNIRLDILLGNPIETIPEFTREARAGVVVTDFEPLRFKQEVVTIVAKKLECAFVEIDAHNIVPARFVSQKVEFGAYTLRPKINRLLDRFLVDIPAVKHHPFGELSSVTIDWKTLRDQLKCDGTVSPVDWCLPGESEAIAQLQSFIKTRLARYAIARNDPMKNAQSNLSPYLHFGHISAQRIALDVRRVDDPDASPESMSAFLEELIIRRELSDNFCLYNPRYDSFDGFPAWAQKSLNEHREDQREFLYRSEKWEQAETHDQLWNACQRELVATGKLHGYMRMYWAKKLLEWSSSPDEAIAIGNYLNDKYELDGCDPNGYVGVAWSIGGVHDRAWFDRPVFGKIRYMNANGCAKKFDVKAYVTRWSVGGESL